eukprot:1892669-Amphidinium_carterae.1
MGMVLTMSGLGILLSVQGYTQLRLEQAAAPEEASQADVLESSSKGALGAKGLEPSAVMTQVTECNQRDIDDACMHQDVRHSPQGLVCAVQHAHLKTVSQPSGCSCLCLGCSACT